MLAFIAFSGSLPSPVPKRRTRPMAGQNVDGIGASLSRRDFSCPSFICEGHWRVTDRFVDARRQSRPFPFLCFGPTHPSHRRNEQSEQTLSMMARPRNTVLARTYFFGGRFGAIMDNLALPC